MTDESEKDEKDKKSVATRRGTSVSTPNKTSVARGMWRVADVLQHLNWHLLQPPSDQWCKLGCMAKNIYGHNIAARREDVQKHAWSAFKALLAKDAFMLIERSLPKSGPSSIVAFKLFESSDAKERQDAQDQLDSLSKRYTVTAEMKRKAANIVGMAETIVDVLNTHQKSTATVIEMPKAQSK